MKWIYMPDFARFANGAEVRKPKSIESADSKIVYQTVTGYVKGGVVIPDDLDNVLRWAVLDSVDHFFRTATANDVGRMAYVSYNRFFRSKIIACELPQKGTEHLFVVENAGRPDYVPIAAVFVEVDQPVAEVNPMTEGYDLTAKRIQVYEAIKEAGFSLDAIVVPSIERSAVYEVIHAIFRLDNQTQEVSNRFLDAVIGAVRPLCSRRTENTRLDGNDEITKKALASFWGLLQMILGDGYDRNLTVMLQKLGQVYVNELRLRSRDELEADSVLNGPNIVETAVTESFSPADDVSCKECGGPIKKLCKCPGCRLEWMNSVSQIGVKCSACGHVWREEPLPKSIMGLPVVDMRPISCESCEASKPAAAVKGTEIPKKKWDSHIDAKEFGRNMGFGIPIVVDPTMKPGEFVLASADGEGAKVQFPDDYRVTPEEAKAARTSAFLCSFTGLSPIGVGSLEDAVAYFKNNRGLLEPHGYIWIGVGDGYPTYRIPVSEELLEDDSLALLSWIERGIKQERDILTRGDSWDKPNEQVGKRPSMVVIDDPARPIENMEQAIELAGVWMKCADGRMRRIFEVDDRGKDGVYLKWSFKDRERDKAIHMEEPELRRDLRKWFPATVHTWTEDPPMVRKKTLPKPGPNRKPRKRFIRVHNEYGQPLTGQWISDDSEAGKLVLPELTPEMLADSDQWSCQDTYLVVDPKNPLVGWVSIVMPEHHSCLS